MLFSWGVVSFGRRLTFRGGEGGGRGKRKGCLRMCKGMWSDKFWFLCEGVLQGDELGRGNGLVGRVKGGMWEKRAIAVYWVLRFLGCVGVCSWKWLRQQSEK